MANRKSNSKGKSREKSQRKARWDWLFYAMLVLIVVLVLWWFRQEIASWFTDTVNGIWNLLGWGLLLIGIAIVTLLGLLRWRKLSLLTRHWNKCLGGIVFALVAWGILALFGLGGNFGLVIIGASAITGIPRIVGLFIIGTILVVPKAWAHLATELVAWVKEEWSRQTSPRPSRPDRQQQQPLPPVQTTPKATEIEPEGETITPVLASAQTKPTKRELRQVAQEVWKKYGESSKSITIDGWRLPPIDILDKTAEAEFSQADNMQRANLIEEALASYGVEAKVTQINAGPTVTQFGIEPGWDRKIKEIKERDKDGNVEVRREEVSKTRVKVERITSLANDLALALASPSIRIEAPVPGQSIIGIEVPNIASSVVSLRGVIETSAFQKIVAKSTLALALGKGAGGEAGAADLDKMPHLLIAGATGSGKTVCLNSAICCLLMHNTPSDVRLIMIDPKRVELTPFNSIPHLAVPVIVKTDKALETLRWLNHEMDNRYQELAKAGARNIASYNKNKQGQEKLPYLVLVIDELADMMMAGFDEVEHILCRLAQLARATGIHLIVATQRPSVDVVTGLIKANFPTRISFAVASQVDSRTILDGAGAEKLLGRGDMLYMPTDAAKPKRLQGCFVSDAETERLVYFWGSQRRQEIAPLKIEAPLQGIMTGRGKERPKDALLEAAKQLAKEHERISTSFLQRRLQIGYPRAARLKDQLDEEMSNEEGEEGGGEGIEHPR